MLFQNMNNLNKTLKMPIVSHRNYFFLVDSILPIYNNIVITYEGKCYL